MKYFETIYFDNLWENEESVNGDGSTLMCSYEYLKFLQTFVEENNIKRILDLGCGDFNLMKHFNFKNIEYLGMDLIYELIEKNNVNYSTHNIKFIHTKIHDYKFEDNCDLIICKDVLQHWSNKNVFEFLKLIKNYKYCLLINDYENKKYNIKSLNSDIFDGEYTLTDLSINPYNLSGEYIFEWYACDILKKCYLIKNYQV
jgi:2-polyprenyl-3-methyl-5-hydroxy-6-metoxy-1,4-benzoquinol methylase